MPCSWLPLPGGLAGWIALAVFPVLLGNVFQVKLLMNGAGACLLRCFIVPAFIVEHIEHLLQFFHLLYYSVSLRGNDREPLFYFGIPLDAAVDKMPDFLDGHPGFFETFNNLKTRHIFIFEHAHAAV